MSLHCPGKPGIRVSLSFEKAGRSFQTIPSVSQASPKSIFLLGSSHNPDLLPEDGFPSMSSCVYNDQSPLPWKHPNSVTRGKGTHEHLYPFTYTCAHKRVCVHTHTHAQAQGHTDLPFTYAQEHVSVEQAILGGHNNYLVEVSVGVTNFSKVYVFIF